MNWLTNYVRPKLRALVRSDKPEVPDNLWVQCPSCEQMVFHREVEAALHVCPNCGHHMRLAAHLRLAMIFDDGAYDTVSLPKIEPDPLKFRDRKRYGDRLKETRAATGAEDAIKVAHGRMGGLDTVAAVFDFAFMGGSMGIAVGEGLVRAARLALERKAPLIVFPASGGARMQEGILSLMQMPRSVIAVQMLREARLPYIVVLTDPTTGGVSASFAMLGDIAIAEPGAVIGFAGARVIGDTIREQLPPGFQRAEYLYEHGMLDMVVHRHELRATLIRVVDLLTSREGKRADDSATAKPSGANGAGHGNGEDKGDDAPAAPTQENPDERRPPAE
ncbi:MAG: acetyl-CoA carboxylase, carboxyltransferase subunit beta [Rhodospirillales bacterium]